MSGDWWDFSLALACVMHCPHSPPYVTTPGMRGRVTKPAPVKRGLSTPNLGSTGFIGGSEGGGKGGEGAEEGLAMAVASNLVGFRQGSWRRRASAGFGTRMRVRGRSRARRQAGSADRQGSVHRRARRRSGVRPQAGSADRQGSVHRRARRRGLAGGLAD